VQVDEPRRDNQTMSIDDARFAVADRGLNRCDASAIHEHVGDCIEATGRIENAAAPD
jgi:hypothetical protein